MGLFDYNADANIASVRAQADDWWSAHFDEHGRCRFTKEELAKHERRRLAYVVAMARCARLDFAVHILSSAAVMIALFAVGCVFALRSGLTILGARLVWSGASGTGAIRLPDPPPALFMGELIAARNDAFLAQYGLWMMTGIYVAAGVLLTTL